MIKYERNIGTITQAEQEKLSGSHVCIVGGGGLGGYVSEMLIRLGVGRITMIDGDTFGESNLNRQLYATLASMGQSKSVEAAKRARIVNPSIEFTSVKSFLTAQNARELLNCGCDLVIDALDNTKARLVLQDACEELGLVFVHGSASEWTGTVCVVRPGSGLLTRLYGDDESFTSPSVPSFTAAFTASMEVAEAVKLLLGREQGNTSGCVLTANLLTGAFTCSLM